MKKKLTAKLQKIGTNTLVIEPENKEALLRKGNIYAVFDIAIPEGFDEPLIFKVVTDVLQNSYYSSENISPIQSLEKAIVDVRDKLTKLFYESGKLKDGLVDFNILAGILWGNVMYVVQYGKGAGFLVREGNIKPINTMSEGSFSSASGVVRDDDVIIFSTVEFAQKYHPQKLISTSLTIEGLSSNAACIILKFIVDASFSDAEMVNFNLNPKVAPQKHFRDFTEGLHKKISGTIAAMVAKLKLPKRKAFGIAPKEAVIPIQRSSIYQEPVTSIGSVETSGIIVNRKPVFKFNLLYLMPVIALILVISIVFSLYQSKKSPTPQPNSIANQPQIPLPLIAVETTASTQSGPSLPVAAGVPPAGSSADDEKILLKRVNAPVFYDLKITDSTVNPTSLAVFTNSIVVADKTSGKLYISTISTPKFTAKEQTFLGISNLIPFSGKLNFKDNEGYKIYDLTGNLPTESYAASNLGVSSTYLGFIYTVNGNKVLKYTKSGKALNESLWGEHTDFEGAKSFDIAVSIYLLKADGTLVSFTKGIKDTFEVKDLDKPFASPVQVLTDLNFNNIYVADSGNKRIAILNKKGVLVRQLKHTDDAAWGDIRGISVAPKEDVLYVLAGTKVFVVSL